MQNQPQPVWLSSCPVFVSVSICNKCKFYCCIWFCTIKGKARSPGICHCHALNVFLLERDPSVLEYDFTPDQATFWSTAEVDLLLFDNMDDAFGDLPEYVPSSTFS